MTDHLGQLGGPMEMPQHHTPDSVWSNFDHVLDVATAKLLEEAEPGTLCAQHAAWDFCGYVWRLPDGRWVDQVWRYKSPVEDIIGDGLEDVIQRANQEYGYD